MIIVLILIDAVAVYALLSLLSSQSEEFKKQSSLELAIASTVGMFIVTFAVQAILGLYLALIANGLWIFALFHILAKLSVKRASIAAALLLTFNLVIAAIFGG